jgi:hypothetical protein
VDGKKFRRSNALDNGMKDPKLFDGVVERCVIGRSIIT